MSRSSYEVHVLREGRWSIEAAFEEREGAERFARNVLGAAGVTEVKVLKFRPFMGFEVEVNVFHRKAPETEAGSVVMTGSPAGSPLCLDLPDLYGFDSRVVMGRLLRQFLDKHQIGATELLHGWAYARKLDSQGRLLRAAVSAVARYQSEQFGGSGKERLNTLTDLVDRALARLRAFSNDRKRLPPFTWADLERSHRLLALEFPPADIDFAFMAQVTEALTGSPSLAGKLDRLIDALEEVGDVRIAGLLQGAIADCLASADVLRDLLGGQPHLGASLGVLGDLLLGRPPELGGVPVSQTLYRLQALLAEGRVPDCRTVLMERVRRVLAGEQPLDRRDPATEPALLAVLEMRLTGPDGRIIGDGGVEEALRRRSLRHRQAVLRGLGMHELADSLGTQRQN